MKRITRKLTLKECYTAAYLLRTNALQLIIILPLILFYSISGADNDVLCALLLWLLMVFATFWGAFFGGIGFSDAFNELSFGVCLGLAIGATLSWSTTIASIMSFFSLKSLPLFIIVITVVYSSMQSIYWLLITLLMNDSRRGFLTQPLLTSVKRMINKEKHNKNSLSYITTYPNINDDADGGRFMTSDTNRLFYHAWVDNKHKAIKEDLLTLDQLLDLFKRNKKKQYYDDNKIVSNAIYCQVKQMKVNLGPTEEELIKENERKKADEQWAADKELLTKAKKIIDINSK